MQQHSSHASQREPSKEINLWKPMFIGLFVFLTVGVSLSNAVLDRFGLAENYALLFILAFLLAVLLLTRNFFIIGLALFGVVLLNLPAATIASFSLDQDVLLAFVCAIVLAPSAYDIVFK